METISINDLKNFEIDIQALTDEYISKADQICSLKEKEILTV